MASGNSAAGAERSSNGGSEAASVGDVDDNGSEATTTGKRTNHAQYMRFFRAARTSDIDGVVKALAAAKGSRSKMQFLFEEFVSSDEDWSNSTRLMTTTTVTQEDSSERFREWWDKSQIITRYGATFGEDLMSQKSKSKDWKWNPDFVGKNRRQ